MGRPTTVTDEVKTDIRKLHKRGVGMLKIAKQLGCCVSTVQRVLAAGGPPSGGF
jgi:IS30 family transposase